MSNSPRLQRVLALCADVLERPGAERMAYLAAACDGDFRLRASVESVLVALKDARQFMDVADIRGDNFAEYVGEAAGDYSLEELLGISPLGAVYRATNQAGDIFAIRVVRGHLWARELIERFSDEIEIYSRIRHRSIASLLDGGVSVNGSPYLVYEYIHGDPIDQYCDSQGLSVDQRLALMRNVCQAAHVGHTHLTAWRSLRPSNVLVTADGTPKLLDFALATLLHRQHGPERSHDTTLSSMWMSQFAAPETFDGAPASATADVYSLGAMLFELLTGQRRPPYPLEEATPALRRASAQVKHNEDWALRKAIAHRRSTTAEQLEQVLSGDIDALIDKAISPQVSHRFDSASSLARAITRYLNRQPLLLDDDQLGQQQANSTKAFALGMTVGVVVLAAFAYLHFVEGLF